jgi:uncharacterized protein
VNLPSRERIELLDVLRGFAVFGILIVNMGLFGNSIYHLVLNESNGAISFFAEGKFYSLFAMLFGIGFSIQIERVSTGIYVRRLLILLAIGLVHAYFIWYGDILAVYAAVGFFLLLFRHARPRTLLVWVILLILAPILFSATITGLVDLSRGMIEKDLAAETDYVVRALGQAEDAYARGSYLDQVRQRARDNLFLYGTLPVLAPSVLAMFLLGLYVGKRKLYENRAFLRAVWYWSLTVGVFWNLIYASIRAREPRLDISWLNWFADASLALGAPALAIFYASSIALLGRLSWLAPVGRMALTNYLLQSVICTAIFYGLGYYGNVGAAIGLALTVGIFIVQLILSHLWMRRFPFGPVEWLWRKATYGQMV